MENLDFISDSGAQPFGPTLGLALVLLGAGILTRAGECRREEQRYRENDTGRDHDWRQGSEA